MVTRKKIRMEQLAAKPKRRRRKPMTEEQKKAAAERLAKARAAKKKTNGSSTPHGVHPSVAARPDGVQSLLLPETSLPIALESAKSR